MSAALAFEYQPGDTLSPSSASKYLGCSFAWCARYIIKVPDPPTGSLTQGKALHAAIGENFRQKLETKEDLPAEGVRAIYNDAWEKMIRGEWKQAWVDRTELPTEFREDEDREELRKQREVLALLALSAQLPTGFSAAARPIGLCSAPGTCNCARERGGSPCPRLSTQRPGARAALRHSKITAGLPAIQP